MVYDVKTVDEYIDVIPEARRAAFSKLRAVILDYLPEGFVETMSYNTPSYVVPHSRYPAGYHCNPKEPVPFLAIASQKHFIGFYHMGIYANPEILTWFEEEYAKLSIGKLDMGKSCVRFKNMDKIPYDLLGVLVSKISVDDWIGTYERELKR